MQRRRCSSRNGTSTHTFSVRLVAALMDFNESSPLRLLLSQERSLGKDHSISAWAYQGGSFYLFAESFGSVQASLAPGGIGTSTE